MIVALGGFPHRVQQIAALHNFLAREVRALGRACVCFCSCQISLSAVPTLWGWRRAPGMRPSIEPCPLPSSKCRYVAHPPLPMMRAQVRRRSDLGHRRERRCRRRRRRRAVAPSPSPPSLPSPALAPPPVAVSPSPSLAAVVAPAAPSPPSCRHHRRCPRRPSPRRRSPCRRRHRSRRRRRSRRAVAAAPSPSPPSCRAVAVAVAAPAVSAPLLAQQRRGGVRRVHALRCVFSCCRLWCACVFLTLATPLWCAR